MEIHWRHVGTTLRDEERAAIEERLRALAAGHADLIDVRITGRESGHHRRIDTGESLDGVFDGRAPAFRLADEVDDARDRAVRRVGGHLKVQTAIQVCGAREDGVTRRLPSRK